MSFSSEVRLAECLRSADLLLLVTLHRFVRARSFEVGGNTLSLRSVKGHLVNMSVDSFQFLLEAIIESTTYYRNALAAIGAILLAKKCANLSIDIWRGIRTFVLGRVWPMSLKDLGSYAVVTGPTSGLGEAFAFELANQGLNIVLLGRNAAKLSLLAMYLRKTYDVTVKCVIIDFSDELQSYETVKQMFDSTDIAVCVNNAGVITEYPSFLNETSDRHINDMINVNVKSLTVMTKLAAQHMEQKRRGLIVNISSMAETGPTPLMSVYAATKAYVTSFSRAVNSELENSGVTVQTLSPSYVNTKMIDYSPELKSSWFVPSPSYYVQNAIKTFGYSTHTSGYWLHGVEHYLFSCLPSFSWIRMSRRANIYLRNQYISRRQY